MRHAEVWLKINDVYEKCIPQASWNQRYWFSIRLGPGRYFMETEAYKVRVDGDPNEYKVSSPRIYLTVLPAIGGLRPKRFQIETWRKLKLDEALTLAKKASNFIRIRYPDTTEVLLVGGAVNRGWTRRDMDLEVFSKKLQSECKYNENYLAEHLNRQVENLTGYPTDVFSTRLTKSSERPRGPPLYYAHVYPVRTYPAATPFRPQPDLMNDDGFTFWHGTQLVSAEQIKKSGVLHPESDVIGLTDDFFYAKQWARVRRIEQRRVGPMAVVEVVVPRTFKSKLFRKEPTSRDILFHGPSLPVRVVKIVEV